MGILSRLGMKGLSSIGKRLGLKAFSSGAKKLGKKAIKEASTQVVKHGLKDKALKAGGTFALGQAEKQGKKLFTKRQQIQKSNANGNDPISTESVRMINRRR